MLRSLAVRDRALSLGSLFRPLEILTNFSAHTFVGAAVHFPHAEGLLSFPLRGPSRKCSRIFSHSVILAYLGSRRVNKIFGGGSMV